ncbi:MAG: glycosyltransferase, partial [Bacteriovoracaceae bacterium]|nr:glycosyltransferase [Bacteriovoracaceae bacterium]
MIKTYLPSVSYVIPYYNERKIIKKCIDSIKNQIYPQDKIEIIIVDNNSTDNGLSIFKEDPSIKIIKELKQGRSYARNTGWKNAKSEYIAFIDSDVTLTKQWTRYLVRSLNNSSRAAVAMGPITPVSKKQSEFGLFRLNNKTIFTNWFFMEIASATQLYPIVNTASCMYEKKVLDKLDGFDVHLQRHEDTDLSFRASELGYDIVFNKHAFSYVYWTDSLINYLKRSFLNGKTYVDLINKHSAQLTFTKNLEMIGHAKNSIKKYFKHDPNFYRIIIKIFSEIFFFVGYVFFKNKKNDRKTHYACKKKNKVELANIEEKTLDIIGQTFGAQGLISKVYLDADTKLTYSQDTVFLYKKDRGNIKFLKLEQNEAKLFLDLYLEKKVLEQPSYLVASLIINLFREELVTFAIDFNHFMFDPSIRVNASVDKKSQIFKYNCSVISQYVKPHTFSIKKEQRCFELLSHILTTKNYSIDHLEEKEKIILLKNNLLSQKKSCLSLFKESFNISQKIKTFNSIVESKDYDINKIYDDMNITNFASTIKQTENIVSSSRSILYVKFFDTFFL